mmetsp:Transcript_17125/g.39541  ORF Transcript_17125/g.39541 Transcript_17125/m.39541 type:complete len:213 (-) Transcript_17125:98-736(-)
MESISADMCSRSSLLGLVAMFLPIADAGFVVFGASMLFWSLFFFWCNGAVWDGAGGTSLILGTTAAAAEVVSFAGVAGSTEDFAMRLSGDSPIPGDGLVRLSGGAMAVTSSRLNTVRGRFDPGRCRLGGGGRFRSGYCGGRFSGMALLLQLLLLLRSLILLLQTTVVSKETCSPFLLFCAPIEGRLDDLRSPSDVCSDPGTVVRAANWTATL